MSPDDRDSLTAAHLHPGEVVHAPSGKRFEVAGRAGPVERQGRATAAAEARDRLLVLKDGELFLCARPDGDIAPAGGLGEGLYASDTRFLSELRLEVGGVPPVVLSRSSLDDRAILDGANADLPDASGPVPQRSLSVTRELRIAAGRLLLSIRLRSFWREPVTTTVSLAFGADFADMFEIRGGVQRAQRGYRLAPTRSEHGVTLAYLGEDGTVRETVVEFGRAPTAVELGTDRGEARWRTTLAPGHTAEVRVDVEPSIDGRRLPAPPAAASTVAASTVAARPAAASTATAPGLAERDASGTAIHSDDERFDAVIARAVSDLRALLIAAPGGRIVAAGIPWYVAAFGRDALITAGEAMVLDPGLSSDALQVLAGLQATADDPWREAEPGKILHELRLGELARCGHIPHTPYYGTVDATPLFLIRVADHLRWTGDLETVSALRPALDAALKWIDEYGDRDGDGFVEYERRSPGGLRNQGWKDSSDSMVHADGRLAEGTIALVEVQGYVYLAKREIADVYVALGEVDRAAELRAQAQALREHVDEAFWNAAEGTYALALDGRKRQVASVTSNAGHLLFCDILDPHRARSVVERLMAPDMFSGWGVRTLSSECPAFNPMSYHNGSIWPHDNAIIAAGMKRYGHDAEMMRIAEAQFDLAAAASDHRLPELVCGFDRSEGASVVAYPVACVPQAWAAAAPLLFVQAMLGLAADAPARSLHVRRPRLPDRLDSLRLEGMRVGDATVSLGFDRAGTATAFTLLDQRGELAVTMTAAP